jgi:hypothetical protein
MQVTCPYCSQVVDVQGATQAQIDCPACGLRFTLARGLAKPPVRQKPAAEPELRGPFAADLFKSFHCLVGLWRNLNEISGMIAFDILAAIIFLAMIGIAAASMDLLSGGEAEQFAGMMGLAGAAQGLLLVGIYAAIRDLRRK